MKFKEFIAKVDKVDTECNMYYLKNGSEINLEIDCCANEVKILAKKNSGGTTMLCELLDECEECGVAPSVEIKIYDEVSDLLYNVTNVECRDNKIYLS